MTGPASHARSVASKRPPILTPGYYANTYPDLLGRSPGPPCSVRPGKSLSDRAPAKEPSRSWFSRAPKYARTRTTWTPAPANVLELKHIPGPAIRNIYSDTSQISNISGHGRRTASPRSTRLRTVIMGDAGSTLHASTRQPDVGTQMDVWSHFRTEHVCTFR